MGNLENGSRAVLALPLLVSLYLCLRLLLVRPRFRNRLLHLRSIAIKKGDQVRTEDSVEFPTTFALQESLPDPAVNLCRRGCLKCSERRKCVEPIRI